MIYLDNAAATMRKPPQVVQAVVKALESMKCRKRGHIMRLWMHRIIYDTKSKTGKFFWRRPCGAGRVTANSQKA